MTLRVAQHPPISFANYRASPTHLKIVADIIKGQDIQKQLFYIYDKA